MSDLTNTEARDEMSTMFRTAWNDNTPAVNNSVVPPVEWDDVEGFTPPPADAAWCRLTIRHADGGQRTFGGTGQKTFERNGLINAQVFTPKGGGFILSDQLAMIVLDAFEGKRSPGGVWFRNARSSEIGTDGPWTRTDVMIAFTYDQKR